MIIVFLLVWTIDAFTASLPLSRKPPQRSIVKRMRNWMPRLDSNDQPSELQNFVRASLTSVQDHGSIALENILVDAAIVTGHSQVQKLHFRASPLRHFFVNFGHNGAMHQININQQCRKELSLQIRSLHRRSELGNLKVLRSTWWRFRNGNV